MIKIKAKDLLKAIKEVKLDQQAKYYPILNHMLFQVVGNGITMVTTDMENFKVAYCDGKNFGADFSACVPMIDVWTDKEYSVYHKKWISHTHKFRPFFDFVKLHAEYDDTLHIDFDAPSFILIVTISGERSYSEFKCMDAQEFPYIKEGTKANEQNTSL